MAVIKRLPDAEFEIMKVIWDSTPPVTTVQIQTARKPYNSEAAISQKYLAA